MEKNLIQEGNEKYYQIISEMEEGYDDEILIRGILEDVLPVKIRWIDGKKEYLFRLNNSISLREYFKGKSISKSDIKELLKKIQQLGQRVEEYLLEEKGFMLSPDSIFYDQNESKWKFVYCKENENQYWRGLSSVIEFFLEKTEKGQESLSFWLYSLHGKANDAEMTTKNFYDGMETMQEPQAEKEVEPKLYTKKIDIYEPPKNDEEKLWIPVIILAVGIISLIILWENQVFVEEITGEIKVGTLVGSIVLLFAIVGIGIWKTWPLSEKDNYIEYENLKNAKLCLISQQRGKESISVSEFPYQVNSCLQIHNEDSYFYIVNKEATQEIYKNTNLLIPWKQERLQDGDILEFDCEEYVVEIS